MGTIYRGYDIKREVGPIAGLPITYYRDGKVAGEANSEDEAMAMIDGAKSQERAARASKPTNPA